MRTLALAFTALLNLIVDSPNIRRDERAGLLFRVRDRIVQPEIDGGWRFAGYFEQGRRLRERRLDIATITTPPPAVRWE